MTDYPREALSREVGTVLANLYAMYDHSGEDKGASLRDFRALTAQHANLNDRLVRVQFEGPDVVSVYVLDSDEAVSSSARFVQMPPTTIALVIAAEMVGPDAGAIT